MTDSIQLTSPSFAQMVHPGELPVMKVAVAVITNAENQILITRRPRHVPSAGLWEFPGGKLEKDELPSEALLREIKEEIGLDVISFDYLGEIVHTISQRMVSLFVYHVYDYQGEAACLEGQLDMSWVEIDNLENHQFPPANIQIIELIKQKI